MRTHIMRMRLLLILLVALSGLGATCGGGSSSQDGAPASSSTSFSVANSEGISVIAPAVPEPSAALVFGVGLLIAGAAVATRRNR